MATSTTHDLRTRASRSEATNVDYWSFRSRHDAEEAV